MHTSAQANISIPVCVDAREPHRMTSPVTDHWAFFRQAHSLSLELDILVRLLGQQASSILPPPPPLSNGVTGIHHHTKFLHQYWGSELRFSYLNNKLLPPGHVVYDSIYMIFKNMQNSVAIGIGSMVA